MVNDHCIPALPGSCPAVLRTWHLADAPDLVRSFRDPEVFAHSRPSIEPLTDREAQAYLADRNDDPTTSTDLQWAIVERSTGQLWGCASLYDIRRTEGVASIGYWLIANARGRGIATQVAITVVTWAQEQWTLDLIELTCGPDNHASRRVAERAGFTLAKVLPSALAFKGGRRDSLLFVMTPAHLPIDRSGGHTRRRQ